MPFVKKNLLARLGKFTLDVTQGKTISVILNAAETTSMQKQKRKPKKTNAYSTVKYAIKNAPQVTLAKKLAAATNAQ